MAERKVGTLQTHRLSSNSKVLLLLILVYLGPGAAGDAKSSWTKVAVDGHEDHNGHEDHEDPQNISFLALRRALQWTNECMEENYGWGTDTPHTVLALVLADGTWHSPQPLQALQLVAKQFELHLATSLLRQRVTPLTVGQLALNVLALVALCKDPSDFYGKDLIARLEHQDGGGVDFETAFSNLVFCVFRHRVRKGKIKLLLRFVSSEENLDTVSVSLLALRCIQEQHRRDFSLPINRGITCLMKRQNADGSFSSNVHSTAIAIQALRVAGEGASWNATRGLQYIMSHQLPDGSFGTLFDTNSVLPLLAGKSLLDAGRYCGIIETGIPDDQVDPMKFSGAIYPGLNEISVLYLVWIEKSNNTLRYSVTFEVPRNSTVLQIMKMAAAKHHHFQFSLDLDDSGKGSYVRSLAGVTADGHSFWTLYLLPAEPSYVVKPFDSLRTSQGVEEIRPKDGDCVLFWFRRT